MISDGFKNELLSYGYIVIKPDVWVNNAIKCKNTEGYIVYVSLNRLRTGKIPMVFGAKNISTIENIKHYIKINHIDVELISEKYVDSHSPLIFKCSCGRLFEASWSNFAFKNKHQCDICKMKRPRNAMSYEIVVDSVKQMGLMPLFTEETYKSINSQTLTIQNDLGYRAILSSVLIERGSLPEWFHTSNPYTIDNINVFLQNTTNGEYVCISKYYNGNKEDLEILHTVCGKTFLASWANLSRRPSAKEPSRHGTRCPYCTGMRTQSLHAVVLKQLFQKLKPGTSIEDQSCRNPMTNCVLPTDIVNHNEKIVVEIQSWFHDREFQKAKDKIKKDFWESQGYMVYTPDIRHYSILEMVQIFFPDIQHIPDWVVYSFESKLNLDMAQSLLNDGLLVSEVAKEMGVTSHRIYDNIYNKKLFYPSNYPNKHLLKLQTNNQQVTLQTAG